MHLLHIHTNCLIVTLRSSRSALTRTAASVARRPPLSLPLPPRRLLRTSTALRMNVTKENFPAVLKEIETLLPTASFVAIDEEMTGIHLPGVFVERMDDTTEERYQKMKSVAEHYKIIQIGLCLFHEEAAALSSVSVSSPAVPRFVARPYNFYIFPEDGAVNMEASAIAFNKSHGMDFNKWIYTGIPYLHDEGHQALIGKFYGGQEGWTKEQMRAGKIPTPPATASADGSVLPSEGSSSGSGNGNGKAKRQIVLDKESDLAYLSDVQSRIFAWLDSRKADEHELLLPEANSFLRLAVHQWLEVAGADLFLAHGHTDKAHLFLESRPQAGQRWKQNFYVTHYTPAEKAGLDAAALDKKRADFEAKAGFKLVWDMLRAARAPIVVHNGFYDVLFMWSHFQSAQLPATLPEFKTALGRLFPAGVFDTKFLSNSRQFAFPMEFLAKRARDLNAQGQDRSSLSELERARLAAFEAMALPESSWTATRFRETHLEKLYLVLQQEQTARIATAGGNAALPAAATAAAAAGVPSPASAVASSPPPPHSEVSVTLAPGFDKYATIGQPGGDSSAAHEAGYDAFMTAVIFASFAVEAPHEEILEPLRANRAPTVDSIEASARAMQRSPWLGRIPLYRHLMALDLNVDPSSGEPRADSLVDRASAIYLLKGFPSDWRTDDVLRMFEAGGYSSAKRKMGAEVEASSANKGAQSAAATATATATGSSADDSKMVDVGEAAAASSVSSASAAAAPLPVVVTAAPKIIWIDDASLYLSIPRSDAAKMDAFVASLSSARPDAVPADIAIAKFVEADEQGRAESATNADASM